MFLVLPDPGVHQGQVPQVAQELAQKALLVPICFGLSSVEEVLEEV